jgi:hypothetical protein
MGQNPSKTPKPSRPSSGTEKEAAKASTKGGQKVTRETTNTRQEVLEQNRHPQNR